jgi:uncharacterized protein (TIGR00255 family)
MTRSMTGFARVEAQLEQGDLAWELRAVNHRFLDAQFKMPEDFRRLEPELRKRLGAKLTRGKVDCSLRFRAAENTSTESGIRSDALDRLIALLAEVRQREPYAAAPDALDMLRWPGLLEEPETDLTALLEAATDLFEQALIQMQNMRESEGARMHAVILDRCDSIDQAVAAMRERAPEVKQTIRQRLDDRIAQICAELDPQRLEQEVAILAQKSDIDEELDRLDSHVKEVRDTLAKNKPVGRRLDFLMQELNREANTIGSKSPDTDTTRIAVDIKVAIEQMREQVQNIE